MGSRTFRTTSAIGFPSFSTRSSPPRSTGDETRYQRSASEPCFANITSGSG